MIQIICVAGMVICILALLFAACCMEEDIMEDFNEFDKYNKK